MVRFTTALLFVPLLAAQLATDVFRKAPPVVEKALRARIEAFYQLHVEGKFRQAEALVAEDSKDYFYSANKPKYVKFAIDRIDWSENFTRAKATVVCHMFVMVPGFAGKPLPVPTPSLWKIENGEWVWYVDQDSLSMTPFGRMKPGEGGNGGVGALPPPPSQEDIGRVLSQVSADKAAVKLDPAAPSSDAVTISNRMLGPIKLVLDAPRVPGLEVAADSETVPAGGAARVTFRYKPGATKPSGAVEAAIQVEPTGQVFPVKITFAGEGTSGAGAAGREDGGRVPAQVSADKAAVKLDAAVASSDAVIIFNRMPGPVKLVVEAPRVPGLEVTADSETVPPGGAARVIFRYKPGGVTPSGTAEAAIQVEPTGQVFPVKITFAN